MISPVSGSDLRTTVFVGNLAVFCTEADVHGLFAQCGDVIEIRIARSDDNSKHLAYGFVRYNNVGSAQIAIKRLNGAILCGRTLKVNRSLSRSNKQHPQKSSNFGSASVHLTFMGHQTSHLITEQSLRDLCAQFGPVSDVIISKCNIDQNTQKQSGYGFVHFPFSKDGVAAAFLTAQVLSDTMVDNVNYKCKISHDLDQRLRNGQVPVDEWAHPAGAGAGAAELRADDIPYGMLSGGSSSLSAELPVHLVRGQQLGIATEARSFSYDTVSHSDAGGPLSMLDEIERANTSKAGTPSSRHRQMLGAEAMTQRAPNHIFQAPPGIGFGFSEPGLDTGSLPSAPSASPLGSTHPRTHHHLPSPQSAMQSPYYDSSPSSVNSRGFYPHAAPPPYFSPVTTSPRSPRTAHAGYGLQRPPAPGQTYWRQPAPSVADEDFVFRGDHRQPPFFQGAPHSDQSRRSFDTMRLLQSVGSGGLRDEGPPSFSYPEHTSFNPF